MTLKNEYMTGTSAFRSSGDCFSSVLYSDCRGVIADFVRRSGGSEQDVDDIIHDTYLLISTRLTKTQQQDVCSPKALIVTVGRNLWLNELRRRRIRVSFSEDFFDHNQAGEDNPEFPMQECYGIYWQHFKNLNKTCRQIIMSVVKKTGSRETRIKLGYTEDYFFKR